MDGSLAPRIVWARSQDSQRRGPDPRRETSGERPPRASLASLRDPILFVVGLAGIVHQALTPPIELELLLIFGAMLGLPLPLKADEIRRNGSNGS
jgi:hypothetical protein